MRLNEKQQSAVRGLHRRPEFLVLLEAIELEYKQSIKDMLNAKDRFEWHQGRALAIKSLIDQVNANR